MCLFVDAGALLLNTSLCYIRVGGGGGGRSDFISDGDRGDGGSSVLPVAVQLGVGVSRGGGGRLISLLINHHCVYSSFPSHL